MATSTIQENPFFKYMHFISAGAGSIPGIALGVYAGGIATAVASPLGPFAPAIGVGVGVVTTAISALVFAGGAILAKYKLNYSVPQIQANPKKFIEDMATSFIGSQKMEELASQLTKSIENYCETVVSQVQAALKVEHECNFTNSKKNRFDRTHELATLGSQIDNSEATISKCDVQIEVWKDKRLKVLGASWLAFSDDVIPAKTLQINFQNHIGKGTFGEVYGGFVC